MNKLMALVSCCLVAASAAFAADRNLIWTGAAGEDVPLYTTAGNWKDMDSGEVAASAPTKNDNVTFDLGASGVVDIEQTAAVAWRNLFVLSGDVTLHLKSGLNGNSCNIVMQGTDGLCTLYVAKGARFCHSGQSTGVTADGISIQKTGEGTFESGSGARFGFSKPSDDFIMAEGDYIPGRDFYAGRIVVRSGMTWTVAGDKATTLSVGKSVLHVERDAKLIITANTSNNSMEFRGLTGEGEIESAHGRGCLTLADGPYRFDGTISGTFCLTPGVTDDEHVFVVGASDTLANCTIQKGYNATSQDGDCLRFADGVGAFEIAAIACRFASVPMTLETVSGKPVTVSVGELTYTDHFQVAGTGDLIFCGNASGFSADAFVGFSGRVVSRAGSLAVPGTLKTDGLAALVAEKTGTLDFEGIQGQDVAVKCLVQGGEGTVEVGKSTTTSQLVELERFQQEGGVLRYYVPMCVSGALAEVSELRNDPNAAKEFTFAGGVLAGAFGTDADVPGSVLPRPTDGVRLSNSGYSNVRVTGGELFLGCHTNLQRLAKLVVEEGGTVTVFEPQQSTTSKAYEYYDGGTLRLRDPEGTGYAYFKNGFRCFYVRPGGVHFDFETGNGTSEFLFADPIEPDATVAGSATAGFTRTGGGILIFNRPLAAFSGAFRNLDGVLRIPNNSNIYNADKTTIFGTGDFEMGNGRLLFDQGYGNNWTLTLGGGSETAKFIASGAATFDLSPREGKVYSITFGAPTFADGGAVFLTGHDGEAWNGTKAKAFVKGDVAADAPVFTWMNGAVGPMAYDADKGFVSTETAAANHILLNGGTVSAATDFGSKTGYVVVGADGEVAGALSGTAGVSFVSPVTGGKRAVTLSAANGYAGGTFVHAVEVLPAVAGALGAGKVTVGGGRYQGGRVRFTVPQTVANAFEISGWGPVDGKGAVVFEASTTLSGDVTVNGPTRISLAAGVTATFSGTVSGDGIQIFANGGTVRFTGDISGLGRIDVIGGRLELVGDAACAGEDDIWFDNSTVMFQNATAQTPKRRLYGVGSLEIRGAALTLFDGSRILPKTSGKPGRIKVGADSILTIPRTVELDDELRLDIGEGANVEIDFAKRHFSEVVGDPSAITGGDVSYDKNRPHAGVLLLVR